MLDEYEYFSFASESVGRGHPDKLCDQISDAILDECIRQDPFSRVAVDVAAASNFILIMGEITTAAEINYEDIARDVVRRIGYMDEKTGIDYRTVDIRIQISNQSPDIAQGLEKEMENIYDLGAGDQGIVFGYATNETEERLPLTIVLAHRLTQKIEVLQGQEKWIRPDSKSQVSILYRKDKKTRKIEPVYVESVVLSVQHSEEIDLEEMRGILMEKVVRSVIPENLISEKTVYYIQPSGKFVIGGPKGDSGLTGRKIIADTYGGWGAHGGGAFSGKDWSKVDRSGAYMLRWIAKSLVDNGLCSSVLIQTSYAIGKKEPISLYVDSYNTSPYTNSELLEIVNDNFNLRLSSIVVDLGLYKPIYSETSVYGHFGKNNLPWEKSKHLEVRKKKQNP